MIGVGDAKKSGGVVVIVLTRDNIGYGGSCMKSIYSGLCEIMVLKTGSDRPVESGTGV